MKTKNCFLASVLCSLMLVLCVVGLSSCNQYGICLHKWGEWTVTTNATCTEEGVQERTCSVCGGLERAKIKPLGHDWDDATCLTPKTCKICSAIEDSDLVHIPNADDGDCTTEVTCSVCGEVTTEANASHTGGIATCTNLAKCSVCDKEYGEFGDHIPNADDGDCTTEITCSVCGEVTTEANASHTGGIATCTNLAKCSVCEKEYGLLAEHIPNADDGDCTTEVTCSVCGEVTTAANASHTGGIATCTNLAKCSVCEKEYGLLAEHISNPDDGDCTTEVACSVCGEIIVEANASHTGGIATCTNLARCSVCDKEYGLLAEHIPNADDGDCTTEVTCSVCGEVTTAANASHTGGRATCKHLAECSVCGKEYGELGEHEGETVWVKHLDSHYLVYSCCYLKITEATEHTIVDGSCTECGFNPTISIGTVEVSAGDTQVEIAISVRDNPGIAGLMMKVQYSSDVLVLTNASSGEALSALTFTAPSNLNSNCTFLWDSTNIEDEDIKDGELLVLTFDVLSSAAAGEYSVLLKISAYDNELNPFTFIIEGGKVTIKNQ